MVFKVPAFQLPDYQGNLAYKELLPTLPQAKRNDFLDSAKVAIEFRDRLTAEDRADLDEYTTWPLAMVEKSRNLCGLLMPLIPPDFFIRTRPRSKGIKIKSLPFELAWLSAKEEQAQIKGIDRSGVQDPLTRIALLTQLVYSVARLHKHGIIYGDLSLKNAVLALNPPRIKLLDCDSAAPLSNLQRRQLHSPFFMPPEIDTGKQKLQDYKTDIYKLGLCVIRGMQFGPGITQATDPDALRGVLDGAALDAVRRAVSADRSRRPTGAELFIALEDNLLSRAAPPAPQHVSLEKSRLIRGTDVAVRWSNPGSRSARIIGPNGLEVIIPDLSKHPQGYVVTPRASGEIFVEFENRRGKAIVSAGNVDLIDLPALDLTGFRLPRPAVPAMPNFSIPQVLGELPGRPLVSTEAHPVPRLEAPMRGIGAVLAEQSQQLQTALGVHGMLDTRSAVASLGTAAVSAAEQVKDTLDLTVSELKNALQTSSQVMQQRSRRAHPSKAHNRINGQKGTNP